ncbi:hypothetical protein [uncultured Desulfovibrio sp.]|uniref:hypothetical protein n=1 Tax=uncultured Desulfovibrio sp. TaxID=167968 RepID=UPI00258781F9|nr:hypothetical protein [uncultured Desulfovibrio sp.]
MKRAVFIIFLFCIFFPSKSFAFDICGWWQSQKMPSSFLKITKDKFYGTIDYQIISKTDNSIKLIIDHAETPSYIEKNGENGMTFTNVWGNKEDYKLVTRDTNLKKKDVRKLCGID